MVKNESYTMHGACGTKFKHLKMLLDEMKFLASNLDEERQNSV